MISLLLRDPNCVEEGLNLNRNHLLCVDDTNGPTPNAIQASRLIGPETMIEVRDGVNKIPMGRRKEPVHSNKPLKKKQKVIVDLYKKQEVVGMVTVLLEGIF